MHASGTVRGSARLRDQLTRAIEDAVLDELAEAGYGRFSVGSVVRRAGIGKAAVYRRWPTKEAMITGVLAPRAAELADLPDSGSLAGDLRAFVTATSTALANPRVAAIVLDLLAESLRSPELARQLREQLSAPRRARAAEILRRAAGRGEVPADLNVSAALDLMAGPFVVRAFVADGPMDETWAEAVTTLLLRALGAPR